MTTDKIKHVLKTYLEDKLYLYYEEGMYIKWVTRDELIDLIAKDILNDRYNVEEEVKYCYYETNKKNNS
jgi:hypothetical protein